MGDDADGVVVVVGGGGGLPVLIEFTDYRILVRTFLRSSDRQPGTDRPKSGVSVANGRVLFSFVRVCVCYT